MTARVSARLTFSFLLMAIAFFAFLLLSASPASAHHKDGHTTGNGSAATTDTSTEGSTEGSGTSGTEEGTTAAATSSDTSVETPSGSISGATDQAASSSGSSSSTTSSSKNEDKAAAGIDKHGYDPDPVHTATPPSTKGPSTCPDYDDGDAGAYDHDNCDGTQGMHGNGGNGKCAGCTGKADDKAPGGQYPGDHNNGYECDHNGGIGKGNPAHSRCATPPPPPPPPCVDNPVTPHDECNPPPPCVDNPNTPQDECNPPPPPCVDNPDTPMDECNPPQPCVDNPDTPMDECNPPPPPPPDDDDVLGNITPNIEPPDQVRNRPPGEPVLPFTGASVGNLLWLALLLMGAGALTLWRTRNRAGANA